MVNSNEDEHYDGDGGDSDKDHCVCDDAVNDGNDDGL